MVYRQTERGRRRAMRRRARLVAAARSIVAREGFAGVTIVDVAAIARVSAGSIYTYFPSKGRLLAAVVDDVAGDEIRRARRAAEFVAHMPLQRPAAHQHPPSPGRADSGADSTGSEPSDRTRRQICAVVAAAARRAFIGPTLARAILVEPVDTAVAERRRHHRDEYIRLLAAIVAAGNARGDTDVDDPRLVASALVGVVVEGLGGYLTPGSAPTGPAAVAAIESLQHLCLSVVGVARPAPGPVSPARRHTIASTT